ncbi:MAG: class I SAM-dependent methyltransferase [Hyphomicrobiaceae bacterium]|jgi:SAM-dependent methyltransferase
MTTPAAASATAEPISPAATAHESVKPAPAFEQQRRLQPRLWDTDWLVLRGMRAAIDDMAYRIATPGKVALDFGCGAMPYAELFTARGVTYRGADLGDAHDIEIRGDGTLAAPDQSTDLVVSFQVLEHVRDIDTYLKEAGRVLRDDGLMLLSTHGTWLYHPHPEDHRRWTREGLIGEIARRGFQVTDCIAVVGPLAWTSMVRLTCFAVALRRVPVIGKGLAAALAVAMNLKAAIEDWVTPPWVTKDNACVYVTLSRRSPVSR